MKKKFVQLTLFLCLFLCVAGCTAVQSIHDERIAGSIGGATFVDVPYQRQTSDYGCGAAALSGVLVYWGVGLSQADILVDYPPADISKGYSIGELKGIVQDRGLKAFAMTGDYGFIKKHISLGRPLIVPIDIEGDYFLTSRVPFVPMVYRLLSALLVPSFDHFVVIIGFDGNSVWLMDPADGIRRMSERDFNKRWEKKMRAVLLVST